MGEGMGMERRPMIRLTWGLRCVAREAESRARRAPSIGEAGRVGPPLERRRKRPESDAPGSHLSREAGGPETGQSRCLPGASRMATRSPADGSWESLARANGWHAACS